MFCSVWSAQALGRLCALITGDRNGNTRPGAPPNPCGLLQPLSAGGQGIRAVIRCGCDCHMLSCGGGSGGGRRPSRDKPDLLFVAVGFDGGVKSVGFWVVGG